ncbi:MAG: transglycosylase domain-containing protein [Anaerolineae bacterium]|jgi:penicillin-binding protein 1C|nr:transglycosylase domain-containing protein [Anaerolineae bacterium]
MFTKWTRRQKWGIALITIGLGLSLVIYFWLFHGLPPITDLDRGLALPSTRLFDRHGHLLYEILPPTQGRNVVLTLDQMPAHCRNAAIATEDANFYQHPGVDPVGIARAVWINLTGGEVIAGGSTITQQVARTLLLDPQQRQARTVERKLKEMILALRLQNAYSKDQVLALYLNQVYFGNLAYGLEAAARAYFGKSAETLSLAECALLIGVIQNPAAYDPLTQLDAAQNRQEVVLGLMVGQGLIDQTDADLAQADDLQFAASPFPIRAPHAVMAVWTQLERLYPEALYTRGLDVTTTIDLAWQETAERIANYHLDRINYPVIAGATPADAHNAAIVAIDPFTGQVLTLLGSPDYFDPRIDGAVNAALALRQPGSTLKPFTYAAAMNPTREQPWTAATMTLDVSTPFVTAKLESYIPANYGFVEHGPVLVREALASSYNIPAVLALDDVGIEPMLQLAASAGLETLIGRTDLDLSVTLGGGEVRLLDLVQAYSIFPNGGYRIQPSLILQITARDTQESLYTWRAAPLETQVIDPRVAFLINDILSDPAARSASYGRVSALDIARPAAAKTGTTTDYRDNWTIGYTPTLVVGVWVGNADNRPMIDVTGVTGAGPIWNGFIREVLDGQPELRFSRPQDMRRVTVCALSGLLPTAACPQRRDEWFIPGTEPTEYDRFYQVFRVDRFTGRLADPTTPADRVEERVLVVLPQEAQAWARQHGLPTLPDGITIAEVAPDQDQGLRILTPAPYVIYQLDPLIPRETQRIRWSVGVPAGTSHVTYFLNDQAIITVETAPFEAWWALALGDYQLTAQVTLADGSTQITEPIPFSVVEQQAPTSRNLTP